MRALLSTGYTKQRLFSTVFCSQPDFAGCGTIVAGYKDSVTLLSASKAF